MNNERPCHIHRFIRGENSITEIVTRPRAGAEINVTLDGYTFASNAVNPVQFLHRVAQPCWHVRLRVA